MNEPSSRSKLNSHGWYTRGYLPHFDGGSIPQHVVLRLFDSFPTGLLSQWEIELQKMKQTEACIERRRRIENCLDKGYGESWLAHLDVAEAVRDSLLKFDNDRYDMHAWCIMPNHVHVLFTLRIGFSLSQVVHSWKGFSARKANAMLRRTTSFWAREYYDRSIRDEQHFQATIAYIENNPVKAGLCTSPQEWPFSSASFNRVNSSVPP